MESTAENFEFPGMWFELKEDNEPPTRVWLEMGEVRMLADQTTWPFFREYEPVNG